MVNQKLLEACKAALECIAKLTPFPNPDAPEEIQDIAYLAAEKADKVRGKLRDAIAEAEKQKTYNWIHIEEALPPDTRWVWAYGPVQPEPTIAAYHADEKKPTWYVQPFRESWYWTTEGISHWLPIEAAIKDNATENNALLLLQRLTEEKDPFIKDGIGYTRCFFCGEDYPDHTEDCIHLESKKLLGIPEPKPGKESFYNHIQYLADSGQLKSGLHIEKS